MAELPDDKLPFGPQVLVRKLTIYQVQAKIHASKLSPKLFEIVSRPDKLVLVRGRNKSEYAAVLQDIANADAAAAAAAKK